MPTVAPGKEAGEKGEGGMGLLLDCERALRKGSWGRALELVRMAAKARAGSGAGATVGQLTGLSTRALLDLQVYCLARLGEAGGRGFLYLAAKLAGEVCPITCCKAE
jgi:hypothetical protein